MYKNIPHNKPYFGNDVIIALQEAIGQNHIIQGKKVQSLETKLCNLINRKYCTAVSSGTFALSLALKVLKIKANDEVIIPSYTCSALYHAVRFNNAQPVYADIEDTTLNLCPESVKKHLTNKTKHCPIHWFKNQ